MPSIEHPEIITSPLDSSFSGTESLKQEGNPPVSQLLNKIQRVLQSATSSSSSLQSSP
ncbi:MAG: hypothetical protein LBG59_04815 [Candidatus Peribacteria bacterium]|nr:hypothetical protein [Candidatus Peribacteria bacterium]